MKARLPVFITVFFLLSVICAATAFACPPCPGEKRLEQPTGAEISAALKGDEWFHWYEADDGAVLVQGSDGWWRYAKFERGALSSLNAKYGVDARPSGALTGKTLASSIGKSSPAAARSAGSASADRRAGGVAEPAGPENLLVILVSFTDISIRQPDAYWSGKMFGDYSLQSVKTDANSSVNDYYKENSGGKFYFTPAGESAGAANDGVIDVSLPIPHPEFPNNDQFDLQSQDVAARALKEADKYVDFSSFNTKTPDGILSPDELHIVLILAGYEQSFGGTVQAVWAHSFGLTSLLSLDQVGVGIDYTEQGEYQGDHPATIGVLAHELGHSLGLPDLYDYPKSSENNDPDSLGAGIYSLMAEGSWEYNVGVAGCHAGSSPTHLDAWCKSLLGFAVPEEYGSGSHTLNSAATGNYNSIRLTTPDPKQYFLLENRETDSGYDRPLRYDCAAGGIAIWHVDTAVLDSCAAQYGGWYYVNEDETHKAVDLEEADEGVLGYSLLDRNVEPWDAPGGRYNSLFHTGDAGCNSAFNGATAPSSRLYGGTPSGVSVVLGSASANAMSVTVSDTAPPAIVALAGSAALSSGMTVAAGVGVAVTVTNAPAVSAAKDGQPYAWPSGGVFTEPGVYRIEASNGEGNSASFRFGILPFGDKLRLTAGGGYVLDNDVLEGNVSTELTDGGWSAGVACNGAPYSAWQGGGSHTFTAEGVYAVTASDASGNSVTMHFTIDNAAPVISAATSAGVAVAAGKLVTSAVIITISDVTAVTVSAANNGAACAWPAGNCFASDGKYLVTASDAMGHVSAFSFSVDLSAPAVTAVASGVSVPSGGYGRADTAVTVWDASTVSKSVKKNGAAISWPSGGVFASEGVYTVTAADKFGRKTVFTFTVDKTKPALVARSGGAAVVNGGYYRRAIVVTASDKYLKSKSATKNGKAFAWPSGGRFTASGAYKVTVKDKAGNSRTLSFVIDTSKPSIQVITLAGQAVRNYGTAKGGAVVAVADGWLYSKSVKLGSKTLKWPSNNQFNKKGTYYITARDKAGNVATFRFYIK